MNEKLVVLVTRKLPDAVEARLARDYNPRFNPDDRSYGSDELIERAEGAVAIIPCHTDALTAEVIARLPKCVKALCNFSVGYNHVDVDRLEPGEGQRRAHRCGGAGTFRMRLGQMVRVA